MAVRVLVGVRGRFLEQSGHLGGQCPSHLPSTRESGLHAHDHTLLLLLTGQRWIILLHVAVDVAFMHQIMHMLSCADSLVSPPSRPALSCAAPMFKTPMWLRRMAEALWTDTATSLAFLLVCTLGVRPRCSAAIK